MIQLNFFADVWGYLEQIFRFLLNTVKSFLYALQILLDAIAFTGTAVMYIPAIIASAVVIFLALAVVKFIIGR